MLDELREQIQAKLTDTQGFKDELKQDGERAAASTMGGMAAGLSDALTLLDAFEEAHPGLVDHTVKCVECGKLTSDYLEAVYFRTERSPRDRESTAGPVVTEHGPVCPACAKEGEDE